MCIRYVKCLQFIYLILNIVFFFSVSHADEPSITKQTTPEKHPYVVLVRIAWHFDCSGAILTSRWVISSAQCYREKFEKSFAFAGEDHYEGQAAITGTGQGRQLIRLHRHPQSQPPRKDLMLGQTNTSWTFNSLVQQIPIFFKERLGSTKNCKGVGFGDSPQDVKMYERHVSHIKRCTRGTETALLCTSNMKAVGPLDIGGPLVCSDNRLYGIITTEKKGENTEGYFTFIAPNVKWIASIAGDLPGYTYEYRGSGGIIQSSIFLVLSVFWVILSIV